MKKFSVSDLSGLEAQTNHPFGSGGIDTEGPKQYKRVSAKKWIPPKTVQRGPGSCSLFVATELYNSIPFGQRKPGDPDLDRDGKGSFKKDEASMGILYKQYNQTVLGKSEGESKNALLDLQVNGVNQSTFDDFVKWSTNGAITGNVEQDIDPDSKGLSYTWNLVKGVDENGKDTVFGHAFLVSGYDKDEEGNTVSYQGFDPELGKEVTLPPGRGNKMWEHNPTDYGQNGSGYSPYSEETGFPGEYWAANSGYGYKSAAFKFWETIMSDDFDWSWDPWDELDLGDDDFEDFAAEFGFEWNSYGSSGYNGWPSSQTTFYTIPGYYITHYYYVEIKDDSWGGIWV